MAQIKIESEVTGNVWKITKQAGDWVEAEDVIMILESMKMEIPLVSEKPGKIISIAVSEGDAVAEGQAIVEIEI